MRFKKSLILYLGMLCFLFISCEKKMDSSDQPGTGTPLMERVILDTSYGSNEKQKWISTCLPEEAMQPG